MKKHEDRFRADSFGSVAASYERFRPRYLRSLLEALLDQTVGLPRVLDVGAGTGILTDQLRQLGCDVLAVEPDPAMAEIARSKGLRVEVCPFELWDPAGRSFDLVTFGQSFQWVDPAIALPKIRNILSAHGYLALAWNRIEPTGQRGRDLVKVFQRYLHREVNAAYSNGRQPLSDMLYLDGFSIEEHRFLEIEQWNPQEWLGMVSTHSDLLTLPEKSRNELTAELSQVLNSEKFEVERRGRLVVARPVGSSF